MAMRAMTLEDVDSVFSIEQTVQSYPWTRGNFTDALNNVYFCRVDEANDEIRGYAVLMPVMDEAELLNIGVAADRQRRGVGRAMLLEMLDMACAKNMIRVFLEVCASNTAALACIVASVSSSSACARVITGMPSVAKMQSRWRAD
jgi:ribosomal protein S18 acetylase RimI-like enzyme